MGEQNIETFKKGRDKVGYLSKLINDIDTLDRMLAEDAFELHPIRIGAEQEFCLLDESWEPSNKAIEILKVINDPHFTHELALYNLEINLDPLELKGSCFSEMHARLDALLNKAKVAAETLANRIVLTGILPTLAPRYLERSYMTPVARYQALNDAIREVRKDAIEIHIKGVDEINLHHDTILYEGCNTSFQAHLQIDPNDFMDTYNWAQAIAGPVLSVCTNSPLLMGRELWEESRIALFTQSVDTRASTFYLDERESRVGFGSAWAQGTAADFYKDSIVRFRSLISADINNTSSEQWEAGIVPQLKALALHNGTVYKWNRLCYGVSNGKPHLRIENRYMPSGPSTADEMANMMLWVGIMQGRPAAFNAIHTKMDFKDAIGNFFNAARYGIAAQFYWDGKLISSRDLMLDIFLPLAYKGLYRMQVAPEDAEKYLSIIEKRIRSMTGSQWIVKGYRKLIRERSRPEALKILTAAMYHRQQKGYSVDAWRLPGVDEALLLEEARTVGDCMKTRTLTAQEDDSAELVFRIMQWLEIHHVPILNTHSELTGLLSWKDMKAFRKQQDGLRQPIKAIMTTRLITVTEETLLSEAKKRMEENNIHCLPVVAGKKLLGILTSNDLQD